jgi:hypothetical protein
MCLFVMWWTAMFASKPLNDVMREISVQVGGSMYPSMNPDKQALAAKYVVEEACRVAKLPESTLWELLDHFGVYEDDDASGTV